MKNKKDGICMRIIKQVLYAGLCIFSAGGFSLLWYISRIVAGNYDYPLSRMFLIFIFLFAGLLFLKAIRINAAVLLAPLLPFCFAGYLIAVFYSQQPQPLPPTKEEIYTGKKVMLLVPHQDDEINLLGGVIEEYIKYGSELWIVYSTNGDNQDREEERLWETVRNMKLLGVEQDHILLLGYGDGWKDKHIYHGEPNETVTSYVGRTKTYGVGPLKAFREGKAYIRENLHNDVKDIILIHRPDILFCVDYDNHSDHKALSLIFDRVMGEILAETEYRPVVLKGFAYTTAWFSEDDLYAEKNILSTKNINGLPYMEETHVFQWDDRIRLPIAAESISDKAYNGRLMRAFAGFVTQKAAVNAGRVINGDKVFWQRPCSSLTYQGKISTSSGDASLLKDFMLLESSNITSGEKPFEGTWIPEAGDQEKRAEIILREKAKVKQIVLYDNPSLEDNVLSVEILFNDTDVLKAGPLLPNGAGTAIEVDRENVEKITVMITASEGEKAGLTEIEVMEREEAKAFPFIKLTDTDGNFAYRYKTDEETQSFRLYSPLGLSLTEQGFTVKSDNKKCQAEIINGEVRVSCPKGERTQIVLEHLESGLKDVIEVHHENFYSKIKTNWAIQCSGYYQKCCKEQMSRFGRLLDGRFLHGIAAITKFNFVSY